MAHKGSRKSDQSWIWGAGIVAVAVAAFAIWYLRPRPVPPVAEIPGMQQFPSEGADHVKPQAGEIQYKTDPPTSGAHYDVWTKAGFYKEPQAKPLLVHALEHGNIIIYYSPQNTPADVMKKLEEYTRRWQGQWDGVTVTPREQTEQVVLTAWTKMLVQPTFDAQSAEAFIDAFRGRGPEKPVR